MDYGNYALVLREGVCPAAKYKNHGILKLSQMQCIPNTDRSQKRPIKTNFKSCGAKPFELWDTFTQDGYITRFLDPDLKSTVCEIGGTNVSTTYIICPKGNKILGITMPFLIMIVKNLRKYFTFEVTALDETGTRRRFRVSNFQSNTQIHPLCTAMPIGLSDGWNQIQFNVAEFMRRAYQKQFVEVQKVKINANIRLRRVYFAERLVPEEQLPAEYRLFFPFQKKDKKDSTSKKNEEPSASAVVVSKARISGELIEIHQSQSKNGASKQSVHKIAMETKAADSSIHNKVSFIDTTTAEQEDKDTSKSHLRSESIGKQDFIQVQREAAEVSDIDAAEVLDIVVTEVPDIDAAEISDKASAEVLDKVVSKVSDKVSAEVLDKVASKVSDKASAEVLDKVASKVSDKASAEMTVGPNTESKK